jgi:hypothetical protein
LYPRYSFFVVLILLAGCAGSGRQFLVSDSYNELNNTTTLTMVPYGNIVIPGMWEKFKFTDSNFEHWFRNADSTVVTIVLALPSNYDVYDDTKSAYENLYAHYKWESDYVEGNGRKVVEVLIDEEKNYILWEQTIGARCRTSLFGLKSDRLYKYSVDQSNWPVEEQREFLIDLYEQN